jgi:molecular chaperone GrpE (heat shock protein)
MDQFQEELYRLVQNVKEGINPFTTKEQDAGGDIQLVTEFAKKWNYKTQYEDSRKELERSKTNAEKEKLDIAKRACLSVMKEVIPVLDDAYQLLPYLEDASPLRPGLEAMVAHLENVFASKKGGVIAPREGDPFDPSQHLAVGASRVSPAYEGPAFSGIIIDEVIRQGYYALGKVIRSAEVRVLSNPE